MAISLPLRPPENLDQETYQLSSAYHKFLWLVVTMTMVSTVTVAFVCSNDVARWLPLVVFVELSSLAGILLNSKGFMKPAITATHIAFWIIATAFSLMVSDLSFFSTAAYVLIVVASGLLLGRKTGIWFALLCAVTQLVLYFSREIGISSPFRGQYKFLDLFIGWLFLLVAATFPSLALKGMRKALRESKEELSELQQAKRTLEESEARYRLLVDGSPDAIFLHGDRKITYVNPLGLKLAGETSLKEVIGRDILAFLQPESWDAIREDLTHLAETRAATPIRRAKVVREDNSTVEVEVVSSLADNSDRRKIQTIMRDITERAQLEQQLLQTQRLEELGQLVGGVAHDLNNILGVVIGHNQLMARWKSNSEKLSKSLEEADKAAKRGANLVKQLLTFARKVEFTVERVAINKVVEEVANLLISTFPENISLSLQLAGELPLVNTDPNQLYQVLLNLCVNARDAMPSGGALSISTSVQGGETVKSRFRQAEEDKYITINVTDTGIGIEKEHLKRIFEPFFTTKEEGHGTGLGLSVVYGIVKAHHGYVDVRSEPGHGAEFSIYLPVPVQVVHPVPTVPEKATGTEGHGEMILVVEDDESVREYLKTMLEANNYRVVPANNGPEALKIFRECRRDISLAIMDMGLPKMNGTQVMTELKTIMPEIRVILMSGYVDPEAKANALKAGAAAFLPKPCDADELLTRIHRALERGAD